MVLSGIRNVSVSHIIITDNEVPAIFNQMRMNPSDHCMLLFRNTTYCSKVAFPLEVVQKDSCFNSPMRLPVHRLYIEEGIHNITCPNVDGYFPSSVKPSVTWYKVRKLGRGVVVVFMVM